MSSNRTNALVGAATIALVRTVVKKKATSMTRRYGPTIAGAAAAVGAVAVIRRSRRSDPPAS